MEDKHYAFADALLLMIPDTPPPLAVFSGGHPADQNDWVATVNALRTYARAGHYAPEPSIRVAGGGPTIPAGITSGFFGVTEETFIALRTLIYGE